MSFSVSETGRAMAWVAAASLMAVATWSMAMADAPAKTATSTIDQRVEELLHRMTLAEKIDQLNQSLAGDTNPNNIHTQANQDRFQPTYGSYLFNGGSVALRNALQREAMEKSRLGIPALFGRRDSRVPHHFPHSRGVGLRVESRAFAAELPHGCGRGEEERRGLDLRADDRRDI